MFVHKYKVLMESFINQERTVEQFERDYLQIFKNETEMMDEGIFKILNDVFEAVDCYWHECLPGQETAFEISEQQLRKEVDNGLKNLNTYCEKIK